MEFTIQSNLCTSAQPVQRTGGRHVDAADGHYSGIQRTPWQVRCAGGQVRADATVRELHAADDVRNQERVQDSGGEPAEGLLVRPAGSGAGTGGGDGGDHLRAQEKVFMHPSRAPSSMHSGYGTSAPCKPAPTSSILTTTRSRMQYFR